MPLREFSAGSFFRFAPFDASEVGLLSAAAPDGCCLLARRLCVLCSLERSNMQQRQALREEQAEGALSYTHMPSHTNAQAWIQTMQSHLAADNKKTSGRAVSNTTLCDCLTGLDLIKGQVREMIVVFLSQGL